MVQRVKTAAGGVPGPRGGPQPREHTPGCTPSGAKGGYMYLSQTSAQKNLESVYQELGLAFTSTCGDSIAAAAAFLRAK